MATSFTELLLIGLILIVLFGSRFAALGKGLGTGIRNLKSSLGLAEIRPPRTQDPAKAPKEPARERPSGPSRTPPER